MSSPSGFSERIKKEIKINCEDFFYLNDFPDTKIDIFSQLFDLDGSHHYFWLVNIFFFKGFLFLLFNKIEKSNLILLLGKNNKIFE